MQVNILEAKNRLSELIKRAGAGEDVVIANRGAPVARLLPARAESHSAQGDARAILKWLEAHPLPEYARRPAAEIDKAIAAERQAWD